MNVFIYDKTQTIHLDNIVAIIFHGNYQFALSGSWRVFAVATEYIHVYVILKHSLVIFKSQRHCVYW